MGCSATDIFLSSLPKIADDFYVTPDVANMLLNAFVAGMAIGSLFCGFLSDNIGRRKIYILGVGLFAVCSFLIAFMPWISIIIFLRFLQGLLTSIFIVVSRQIVTDICDKSEQVLYTGMLSIGIMLSPAIAPVIGAYIAHYYSWHMCFIASGILAVFFFLIILKYLPETIKEYLPLPKKSALLNEYGKLFKSRDFCFALAITSFCFAAYYIFLCTSSFIFIDEFLVDRRMYAKIFLLLSFAYLLGNSLMQKLNKKGFLKNKLIMFGVLLSFVGACLEFLVYFTNNISLILWILIISAFLLRAGYAVLVSPSQVVAMNACEDGRKGTAMGVLMFFTFFFGAVCSSIVSFFHFDMLNMTIISIFILIALSFGLFCKWGFKE